METVAPAAVLWDMDGTLVDTEPYWMSAEIELVTSFGGGWTHADCLRVVGLGLWESAKVFQQAGVALDADTIVYRLTASVQEQLDAEGIPWRPGARELLAQLRERGTKTALVTMSVRSMAEQIAGLVGFPAFDVIVTGDSVANAKPHPEPYLTAARLLGVDAADCVAIEDSVPGLASAVASGAVTIGVPHQVPLAESDAYTLFSSLSDVSAADIDALFAGAERSTR
ncbi:HAD family phosphatase [Rathayibacter sp. YIM 133350]|uniref:HAD family hydrolase n=1 Tax=Rathayibacter sp. YIM 133350 TaxID=3131992 RepID=UPI00307CC7F3